MSHTSRFVRKRSYGASRLIGAEYTPPVAEIANVSQSSPCLVRLTVLVCGSNTTCE